MAGVEKKKIELKIKGKLALRGKAQDKSWFSTVPHGKSESETDPFELSQTRRA